MECFKVYSNEIAGRFDPLYLKNRNSIDNLKTKYQLIKLGDLLKTDVQYGANEIAIDRNRGTDIRYIRITDIDEHGILKDDEWKTAQKIEDKYLLNEDDILFARSGATAGKCFIYKNEYGKSIFAGYLIRFIFNNEKVNPKYIFYYTQLPRYKLWVLSIQRPSGQPNINSEEFKSFTIPLPFRKIQAHVVALMDSAYKTKKTKNAEVQKLLDSIDDYLFDQLGIKLPELKEQITYAISSGEVQDNRCDAYYYQPKFEDVEKAIRNGKFEVKRLKDSFKDDLIKGILPNGEEKKGETKVLQIKNILRNGLVNTSEYVSSKNIFKPEHKIKTGEVIVVITGATIGKVGLWYSNEDFYLGGDMVKFVTNDKSNPYYIQSFLLSQLGQYQLLREVTGATNKHLSPDDVKEIQIPLPPRPVQDKIAEEVKNRMQRVEELQKEVKEELEKAKQKVEKIILGNN